MTDRYIFHLSFPVLDLQQTRDFYVETLGADVGRESDEWLDILIWGHQITLQCLPDAVLADGEQAKFYLKDPGHNLIEIKAYRDFDSTLNQHKGDYDY
jgi:extradiol dioxygenase family protein